jgi:LacI family transcriptional regulator
MHLESQLGFEKLAARRMAVDRRLGGVTAESLVSQGLGCYCEISEFRCAIPWRGYVWCLADPVSAMKRKIKVSILLQMSQNFDQGIFRGIAAYAKESHAWSLFFEQEQQSWTSVLSEPGVRGLIVNLDSDTFAEEALQLRVPMVGFGGGAGHYHPDIGIPYVSTDNEAIGRLAAEHLLETGLRHFGYCGFPQTRNFMWTSVRENAFCGRLAESGFDCQVFHGTSERGSHAVITQREIAIWLRSLPKPVGVMGCYDWRARHVLEACHTSGLRVPDDVALIGVDNDAMLCDLTDPPLTSIEQGRFGIGYAAASLLDQLLKGKKPERLLHVIPPLGVITRQSTNLIATSDAGIAKILRLIRDHACGGLTADAVAAKEGISRATLDNRLKACIGRTADLQIRLVRVAMAENLLVHTNLTLREIATRAGFGTEQYFCAVWKKEKGSTPGQFRSVHGLSR